MRKAPVIELSSEERSQLMRLARSKTTSVRLARRAQIVLGAADGLDNETIAAQVGAGRVQVGRWRTRYAEGGLAAIEQDLPRGGRPVKVDAARIVRLTTQTLPAAATHWSTRTMAAQVGVSDTTVLRVWRQHGLKPHRVRSFKVSRDPQFVEKLEDIVGLYMSPPEHALVLCCDEKSQVQALDRTQPGLALKKGRATVRQWLAEHPRFHMHFTPTSASWLNMVERFFRDLTTERLRRGVFTSVPDLIAAIEHYVAHHNADPKPFIWTKSARDILQKVIRANGRLSSKQNEALH